MRARRKRIANFVGVDGGLNGQVNALNGGARVNTRGGIQLKVGATMEPLGHIAARIEKDDYNAHTDTHHTLLLTPQNHFICVLFL